MKAEFLTFQSTYVSLRSIIHEPRNISFKRRRKFDGTSVFSTIQTICTKICQCIFIFAGPFLFLLLFTQKWKYHGKTEKNHCWVDIDLRPALLKDFLYSTRLLVDVDQPNNHFDVFFKVVSFSVLNITNKFSAQKSHNLFKSG